MNENWTELKIKVPAPQADIAGAIANMVVPYGIYMEDYSHLEEEALEIAHIDLIDEEAPRKRTGSTPSSTSTSAQSPTPQRPSPSWRSASRRKISPMKSTGTPAWRRTGSTTGRSTSTPSRWGRSSSSAPCGRRTTMHRAARCSTWSRPGLYWHRHPRDHPPVPGTLGEVRHPRH